MSLVFVAATGTDIGKTYIGELILKTARSAGYAIEAVKPVLSGFDASDIAASDSGRLLKAMGKEPTMEAIDDITPWRFKAPLSPDMAAKREGASIPFDDLVAFCRAAEKQRMPTLVEGVGGVQVPLGGAYTTLDWQAALKAKCLLVAGTYLGTISHTLTAIDALANRSIVPAFLVLNQSLENPVSPEETAEVLGRYIPDIPIYIIERNAEAVPKNLIDDLVNH